MDRDAGTPNRFSFLDIRDAEFMLVDHLSKLRDIAKHLNAEDARAQIAALLAAVKRRELSIAVVGEFKRGKSTFINALLGKEILPADVVPTSATLNRVTHGTPPRVQVFFKGKDGQPGPVQDIGIDQLADYVTKLTPEAEAIAAQIEEAVVYYPVPYCENNVSIIDTPGLNDNEAMTNVTLGVLPRVDVAIMVVMATAPFSQVEGDFLNNLLARALGGMFFVVTAIDRLRKPEDRAKALETVRTRIMDAVQQRAEAQFGKDTEEYALYLRRFGKPRVFGLSGVDALEARQTNDTALLASSGFNTFERALSRFLTEERASAALRALAERLVMVGEPLLRTIDLQRGALQMEVQDFDRNVQAAERLLVDLSRRSDLALAYTDRVRVHAQHLARPYTYHLENELIRVASSAIDQATLNEEDLNRASIKSVRTLGEGVYDRARDRLGVGNRHALLPGPDPDDALADLSSAIRTAFAQVLSFVSENIQTIVQQELLKESERLRTVAQDVNNAFVISERGFVQQHERQSRSVAAEGLAPDLVLVTDLGSLSGVLQATSFQNIGRGSLASLGSVAAQRFKRLWDTIINRSAAPQSTADRVTAFRTHYKQLVSDAIKQDMKQDRIDLFVDAQIAEAFQSLTRRAQDEFERTSERHRQALDQVRRVRERKLYDSEHAQAELERWHAETQAVLAATYDLTDQLASVMQYFDEQED